jgi:predicted molibdopterin-dependent oxidoreductase YjgC
MPDDSGGNNGLAVRLSMGTDAAGSPGTVTFWVDGEPFTARAGQSLGAALLAQGRRVLRVTRREGRPRGMYCAMGACFDCIVTIDGRAGIRACMVRVAPDMRVVLPGRFGGPEAAD